MNGIIIIDKPAGWTSHDVVAKLRGAANAARYKAPGTRKKQRVGHGGTLDPMATGVLPVFFGRATRASEFCENSDKEYIAGIKLGVVTDTQDITGSVIRTCEAVVTDEEVLRVLPGFLGTQKQTPPMYSAVKHEGKKLYELARRGIEIPREPREINIREIELLSAAAPNEYLLRIVCTKGTYIRTLCHDVGSAIGCGGTMSSLRRTRAGAFSIDQAHELKAALEAISSGDPTGGGVVLPIDTLFVEYPALTMNGGQAVKIKRGAQISASAPVSGKHRIYAPDGELLMLGDVSGGVIKAIKTFYETEA